MKSGFVSHRVSNYPPLDNYGEHKGYVLKLLGKGVFGYYNHANVKYIVVSKEVGEKYIDNNYLCVMYTGYHIIDISITESDLLGLLKKTI